ncbi:hypothetical protein L837_3593 [Mycobacterium avium MAV_061107_1842]|nr:hypothetical protein L837_3593 [Mycobacterium avium MAV_061107_1842]
MKDARSALFVGTDESAQGRAEPIRGMDEAFMLVSPPAAR